MNHRAKFDAASFILSGEIVTVQTHKHKQNKQNSNRYIPPCLSTSVDKADAAGTTKLEKDIGFGTLLLYGYFWKH